MRHTCGNLLCLQTTDQRGRGRMGKSIVSSARVESYKEWIFMAKWVSMFQACTHDSLERSRKRPGIPRWDSHTLTQAGTFWSWGKPHLQDPPPLHKDEVLHNQHDQVASCKSSPSWSSGPCDHEWREGPAKLSHISHQFNVLQRQASKQTVSLACHLI